MAGFIEEARKGILEGITARMSETADKMVADMKSTLEADGHIDTGALRDSIRQTTRLNGDEIETLIYADAQSEEGAYYAEFIEYGTGAAHGRPGGRVGTWRYRDRHGRWHTTDGMDASPFIRPAVAAHIGELEAGVKEELDIEKYARMKSND